MKRSGPLQRRTPLRSPVPPRNRDQQLRASKIQRGLKTLRTKISQPAARERDWREMVRDLGSVVSGAAPVIEIHHCVGRTGRHDGVAIGHWWILPLTPDEHRGASGSSIHSHPQRKAREKELFERVLVCIVEANHGIPDCWPPSEVLEAIRSYHR